MIRNYFKIAFRNLKRHKGFAAINIVGLAVGMACAMVILLWVKDELSYDSFHARADRLYRITGSTPEIKAAVSVAPLAAAIREQIPAIKNTVRLSKYASHFMSVGDTKFDEHRIFYADSNFLDVFSFPLLEGDSKTALENPGGLLLSESMAIKYFGSRNALGKIIRLDNETDFVVSGVLEDVPLNSHLQFDFIMPMAFLASDNLDLKENRWCCFNFYTYIEVDESFIPSDGAIEQLNKDMTQVFLKNNKELKADLWAQPVKQIHLSPEQMVDVPGHGNIQYVQIFSVVAVFILIVACINFMNLSTARFARRAKEVGLRKTVGAIRGQLIFQFLSESCMISLMALCLGILLAAEVLPFINDLVGKHLQLDFSDLRFVLTLLAIGLMTGLISGTYPAFFLSAFHPVNTLKSNTQPAVAKPLFRNTLVVAQFVVSIILLVGTAIVYFQMEFIRQRNPGFEKENLLYMPMSGALWGSQQAMEAELLSIPATSNYTITQELPTNLTTGSTTIGWAGKDPNTQPIFYTMNVDENFIDVFGIALIAGRNFSGDGKTDSSNFIVNERALKTMGMSSNDAIGKAIWDREKKGVIIGVVKDFNFKPIQTLIEPLVFEFNRWGGVVVVKAPVGGPRTAIDALEKLNHKLNPGRPFNYSFIDQDLANLYRGEQQMASLSNFFAGLAIFISCLGLYGLSAYTAEQRTKEFGIRKVLGASSFAIVQLLARNFAKLIAVSILIAVPTSWYFMNQWLLGFAYHINISWSIFALACLATLLMAAMTVSYEAIKAAVQNPVDALKGE